MSLDKSGRPLQTDAKLGGLTLTGLQLTGS